MVYSSCSGPFTGDCLEGSGLCFIQVQYDVYSNSETEILEVAHLPGAPSDCSSLFTGISLLSPLSLLHYPVLSHAAHYFQVDPGGDCGFHFLNGWK